MDRPLVAFQDKYFEQELGFKSLREILKAHQVDSVWELREYGPEYELESGVLEPIYNGAEGCWCSEGYEWLIYASHESSVTLGGEWLIDEAIRVWPNWDERIWNSPFFS